MTQVQFLQNKLKESTHIQGGISSHTKSARFWAECMAVCALLASNHAYAISWDAATVNEHSVTGLSTTPKTYIMPTVTTDSTPVTFSWLNSSGTAVTGNAENQYSMTNGKITYIPNSSSFTYAFDAAAAAAAAAGDVFSLRAKNANGQILTDTFLVNKAGVAAFTSNPKTQSATTESDSSFALTLPTFTTSTVSRSWLDSSGAEILLANNKYTTAHGYIEFSTLKYVPNAAFVGHDYFTYQARDSSGQVATCTFDISVTAPVPFLNDAAFDLNSLSLAAGSVNVIKTKGLMFTLTNLTGSGSLRFVGGGQVSFGTGCTYTGSILFDTVTRLVGSLPRTSSSYPVVNVDANVVYTETGQFTGPSALVKSGPGEVVLASSGGQPNNYAGGTVIKDGIVSAINNTQIPVSGAVSFESSGQANSILKSKGLTSIANPVIFTSKGTVDTNGNNVTASGPLSGAGDFYKTGNGEFFASAIAVAAEGSPGNTQTGATYINGGALRVTPGSLGQTSHVYINGGVFHVTESTTSTCPITLGGSGAS